MDEIDISILNALQQNARQKHNELARQLKIAPSTVSERVKRMESRGLIKEYRATIDTNKAGFAIQAFISIRLGRHEKETIQNFEEQLTAIPHVLACYHLTGRYDYLLHVVAADLDELGQLVKNVIGQVPGYVTSETFVILSEIKSNGGLPIDLVPGGKTKHK